MISHEATSATDLTDRIRKIELFRVRTRERGASEAEEETAALKIGRTIMRHPELSIVPKAGATADDQSVVLHGVFFLRETRKALMVSLPGIRGPVWFPRSHVRSVNRDQGRMTVSRWIWERKGAEHGR